MLRQVALFDVTSEVREAAEAVLRRWGSGSPQRRAAQANEALTAIARKRANGIGPLLFGETGVPGVPSLRSRRPGAHRPFAQALTRAGAVPLRHLCIWKSKRATGLTGLTPARRV